MVRNNKEIIAALKMGGDERRRVFKFWEEEYGSTFGNGAKGYKLYCEFLEVVRKSGDEKAVEEFQGRFIPLCDKEVVKARSCKVAENEDVEELEDPGKRGLFGRLFGRRD
jgi:hypothetical protein